MTTALQIPCLEREGAVDGSVASGAGVTDGMGPSEGMQRVAEDVARVAPTDFTVLITGETGAGKEVVARTIHRRSRRASGPFVPVDCGSIPASLIESELFGHEKGAFTGADRCRLGKFELAAGGTLFLDEISNLALDVQPKLLRALQERSIWRVGATQATAIDIRVIAASSEDLVSHVAEDLFRRDLYHRLNEFGVTVPPLRERREDIPVLAQRFFELTNRELRKQVGGFTSAAAEALLNYRWPGNVRELRNVIRRAVLLAEGEVEPRHLGLLGARHGGDLHPLDLVEEVLDGSIPLKEMVRHAVEVMERAVLSRALKQTGGNKAQAARLLHIDYKTIHKKTREYGILPL
jgi:two-component system nitrogen regulation response regulator GlnG